MQTHALSRNELHAIQNEWVGASNAVVEAEAEALDALLQYRRGKCDATKLRMVYALEVRNAANARMRALVEAIWANPL